MAYKYARKNRNTRLTDFEWDVFKKHLGAEWLRTQIREKASKLGLTPPATDSKD